jgi:hypothetical protein
LTLPLWVVEEMLLYLFVCQDRADWQLLLDAACAAIFSDVWQLLGLFTNDHMVLRECAFNRAGYLLSILIVPYIVDCYFIIAVL